MSNKDERDNGDRAAAVVATEGEKIGSGQSMVQVSLWVAKKGAKLGFLSIQNHTHNPLIGS